MVIRAITIEQKLFARKKRKRVLQHKQGIRKVLTIVLPAQEAVGGQPLAPILGQVQILVSDFVDKFNDKSSLYPSGFPLNVKISVDWDKSYDFEFLPVPFINFVFDFIYIIPVLNSNSNFNEFLSCIYINDFFKLFTLFKQYYNFNNINDFQIFNLIKSLIFGLNINISFISRSDFINNLTIILDNDLYINCYFFMLSELSMVSFSTFSDFTNKESTGIGENSDDLMLQLQLKKKEFKKKNKKKYVI